MNNGINGINGMTYFTPGVTAIKPPTHVLGDPQHQQTLQHQLFQRRPKQKVEKSCEDFKQHERIIMEKRIAEINNVITKKCHILWNQYLYFHKKPEPLEFRFTYEGLDSYLGKCDDYKPEQHKDNKQKWWNNQKASEMSQHFLPAVLRAADEMALFLGRHIGHNLHNEFTNYITFELLETAITSVFSTQRSGSNEVFLRTSFQYAKAGLRKKLVSYFSDGELREHDTKARKKKDLWQTLIKDKKDRLFRQFSLKRQLMSHDSKAGIMSCTPQSSSAYDSSQTPPNPDSKPAVSNTGFVDYNDSMHGNDNCAMTMYNPAPPSAHHQHSHQAQQQQHQQHQQHQQQQQHAILGAASTADNYANNAPRSNPSYTHQNALFTRNNTSNLPSLPSATNNSMSHVTHSCGNPNTTLNLVDLNHQMNRNLHNIQPMHGMQRMHMQNNLNTLGHFQQPLLMDISSLAYPQQQHQQSYNTPSTVQSCAEHSQQQQQQQCAQCTRYAAKIGEMARDNQAVHEAFRHLKQTNCAFQAERDHAQVQYRELTREYNQLLKQNNDLQMAHDRLMRSSDTLEPTTPPIAAQHLPPLMGEQQQEEEELHSEDEERRCYTPSFTHSHMSMSSKGMNAPVVENEPDASAGVVLVPLDDMAKTPKDGVFGANGSVVEQRVMNPFAFPVPTQEAMQRMERMGRMATRQRDGEDNTSSNTSQKNNTEDTKSEMSGSIFSGGHQTQNGHYQTQVVGRKFAGSVAGGQSVLGICGTEHSSKRAGYMSGLNGAYGEFSGRFVDAHSDQMRSIM